MKITRMMKLLGRPLAWLLNVFAVVRDALWRNK